MIAPQICRVVMFVITGMRQGDVLGHEFMGIVDAVGPAVTKFKKGDRAVASFEMGCGQCYFCKHEQFSSCDTTNPRYEMLWIQPRYTSPS